MRSLGLALALMLLPASAHAACGSIPECLMRLRFPHADAVTVAKAGAVVGAAVIGVGGLVTAAMQKAHPKEAPNGVVVTHDESGRAHANLQLVPAPHDKYYNANGPDRPKPPSGAFKFNDTAANVMIGVGGAAVLGSIIAGIVQSERRHR
jgi:hypothetical protein